MKTNRTQARTDTPRGFTLVELIVSIGLFLIVVTIAMGAYVSLISLDRKARAMNDVMTNLSFVVDSMSRSIRTGKDYSCAGGPNCWGGGTQFNFTDIDGTNHTYLLKTDGTIGMCTGDVTCTGSNASSLTDPRVTVTKLKFYAQGTGTGGPNKVLQPHVIFTMTGTITPEPNAAPISFSFEGAATQRIIDI